MSVMRRYEPKAIEPKWQQIWDEKHAFEADDLADKPKTYISPMFPYPSGAGMHVGHIFEHAIVDATARFYRAQGHNVMYPMGWDSFGLPAENYAIKTGTPPQETTKTNIANFKNQLRQVGLSIDWTREVNTSDPKYYKWTQWIFTQLYERGLAYQKDSLQWWCEIDQTVLANEQVVNGKCWRHDGPDDPLAVKKNINQWFFKITDYADVLLDEIPALDWPEKIKTAQTNWIGKSQGAEVEFTLEGSDDTIAVFTTRPDTIFGATFLVLAPEHPLVKQMTSDDQRKSVEAYAADAVKKPEIDRLNDTKEKTGVFTGSYAINPATGTKIPVWVADYVLYGYGTGAIMAVPAHDERDFAFAKKFDLEIKQVIMPIEDDPTNPPQAQFEEVVRDTVIVHLKDKSTGKYALLDWHGTLEGITTAIMGGIEDGQTAEEAALMEIREEAALENVTITSKLRWVTGARYCASHKQQNRKAIAYVLEAEVENLDNQGEISEAEQKTHSLTWVDKSQVLEALIPLHQKQVWEQLQNETVLPGKGELINSGAFDGQDASEAREHIVAWLEQQGVGKTKTTYKMRDWLISRQRYWGAPIPIIHCDEHGAVPVPQDQLPVVLPVTDDFAPKGDGKSALGRVTDWVNTTCPTCGGPAKRETDTMDGFACSSWYLLRYTDPQNTERAWTPELANYWSPVDFYVGGDHAVAHLLYVRFWTHVFKDMGLVDFKEPVKKLVYHGLIGAEDGRKMSKSLGNVVDPLEIIGQGYGADSLRTYELFLGPIDENSSWSSTGIAGVYRFINRVWTLVQEFDESDKSFTGNDDAVVRAQHKTIRRVTDSIHRWSFNTAIAGLMEYVNDLYKLKVDGFSYETWHEALSTLVQMIAPFAPHVAEELWQQLGHSGLVHETQWPAWDDTLIVEDTMTIIVQVNGKLRAKLDVPVDTSKDEIEKLGLANEHVQTFVAGKEPVKIIYVPGKILNIVVK